MQKVHSVTENASLLLICARPECTHKRYKRNCFVKFIHSTFISQTVNMSQEQVVPSQVMDIVEEPMDHEPMAEPMSMEATGHAPMEVAEPKPVEVLERAPMGVAEPKPVDNKPGKTMNTDYVNVK